MKEASESLNHRTTLLSKAISPPRTPPQRKILPQATTDLIRSKVIESRDTNAQQDCAKKANHQIAQAIGANTNSSQDLRKKPDKQVISECLTVKNTAKSCVMKEIDTIDHAHQHKEYAVGDEGSPSKQKPANQSPVLEINLQKDSRASSPAGAESSKYQEQAQPNAQKLVH